MNQYTIVKADSIPNWNAIPLLSVAHHLWQPKTDIKMDGQICYSDNGLHIHLLTSEKDIRADHTDPFSMVCEDSCMEFFFCPAQDNLRYFNFEINPNGCMYIGFSSLGKLHTRLLLQEDLLFHKSCRYTQDGWEAYFFIPLSLICAFFPSFKLIPGEKIRANVYKCGEKTISKHYIAWNPVSSEFPDFHRPQDFGEMILN